MGRYICIARDKINASYSEKYTVLPLNEYIFVTIFVIMPLILSPFYY